MDSPRAEKVAVVDEVRARLEGVDGAILTEYRGLTVAELAELRKALGGAGGEYKIYKNTLVRRAVSGSRHEPLQPMLTGPTAIAFVSGDVSAVAKALRDYARTNPALVVKGGMFGDGVLSPADLTTLADLPSRDVLLARLAGGIAAPLQQLAGLLQALPRNLAYGLKALVEQGGGAPSGETVADTETVAETFGPVAETETETETEAETGEAETDTVAVADNGADGADASGGEPQD
jgi:large subunit ribosomal protein L10